jgi:DeoR/GlpR family transcriptional regulator of sugar metabolism
MPERWIVLLTTNDQLEAEMIKDILESGDITVVLRSSKVSPYPVNIGKMGEIKILIRDSDKEAADEVLEKLWETYERPHEEPPG